MEENSARQEVIYSSNRDPYKAAEEENLTVVLPTEFQLQLDLDTEEEYNQFITVLRHIEKDTGFYFAPFEVSYSKSGPPKRHVTLTTTVPMSVWQRIALQFALGSDPVRERLNCERVLLNDPFPIAFFEKKGRTDGVS